MSYKNKEFIMPSLKTKKSTIDASAIHYEVLIPICGLPYTFQGRIKSRYGFSRIFQYHLLNNSIHRRFLLFCTTTRIVVWCLTFNSSGKRTPAKCLGEKCITFVYLFLFISKCTVWDKLRKIFIVKVESLLIFFKHLV